jgi:hypothetical protein
MRRQLVQRKQQRGMAASEQSGSQDSSMPSLCAGEGEPAEELERIGFVTSEAPKGLPPWRGATAVCRANPLWRQRHAGSGARTWPGSALVAFRNPDSTAWRLAEAFIDVIL